MSEITEYMGVLQTKDSDGNVSILYPETKAKLVDGLTSSNGVTFKFGYNPDTDEYGYIVTDSEGADTFCPFSNDGKSAEEYAALYASELMNALRYSGLGITEDMSYEDICAVLMAKYPEHLDLLAEYPTTSDWNISRFTVTNSTINVANGVLTITDKLPTTTINYNRISSAAPVSKIDLTPYSKIKITANNTGPIVCLGLYRTTLSTNAPDFKLLNIGTTSVETEIDVSSYYGEYYVAFRFESGTAVTTTLSVSELKLICTDADRLNYIYNNGIFYNKITSFAMGTSSRYGVFRDYSSSKGYLYMQSSQSSNVEGSFTTCIIGSDVPVDITNCNTLRVKVTQSALASYQTITTWVGIGTVSAVESNVVKKSSNATTYSTETQEIVLDISEYEGDYYINLGFDMNRGNVDSHAAIHEIQLI